MKGVFEIAVTMKELAEKLGVSRATVDRALHNRSGVHPQVAEQIRQLAKEMGFTPNRAGRILAARKQPLKIIYVVPQIGNEFFYAVEEGAQAAARELEDFGVSVICKPVRAYHAEEHIKAVQELMEEDFGALCLSTVDEPQIRDCIDELTKKGVAVVTVNNDLSGSRRLFYIGCDYYEAGSTAAGLFSNINHEKLNFLIVSGTRQMTNHIQRLTGFVDTMNNNRQNYEIVAQMQVNENEESAYDAARQILIQHPEINCVYMTSAAIAGVCKAIIDLKKDDSLYVISFDDVETVRRYMYQGVINFTLCQDPWTQGYKAVHMLFDYFVDDRHNVPENYITKTIIKIRENLD
jgi:LacI family transcriptional regulator